MTCEPGKPFSWVLLTIIGSVLVGCAQWPQRGPQQAGCEQAFRASDTRVREAGFADAGAGRITGFRYLRVNRFLASLRDDLEPSGHLEAWMERLRGLDMHVRAIELNNLYPQKKTAREQLAMLDRCGKELLAADLAAPGRVAMLRERARVADAYVDSARFAGAYPLAVPFLKLGIARWRAETEAQFRQTSVAGRAGDIVEYIPDTDPPIDATLVRQWLAAARAADPLSVPELSADQQRAVAAHYAPIWQVHTEGSYDAIGSPRRGAQGLTLASDPPIIYVKTGFTRFGGQILLQITYTAWFAERPAGSWLDPFAGALDGLIWRVTLDTNGLPLLYDSIHPCGCYHLFFPGERVRKRDNSDFWREAATSPTTVAATRPIVLRAASGTHFLQSITADRLPAGAAPSRRYSLRDYDQLRVGGPQRLFDASGYVPGSERGERWFLWPSGVPNAGAMRQLGTQVTAFVGKRYFDDPALLGRYFERR